MSCLLIERWPSFGALSSFWHLYAWSECPLLQFIPLFRYFTKCSYLCDIAVDFHVELDDLKELDCLALHISIPLPTKPSTFLAFIRFPYFKNSWIFSVGSQQTPSAHHDWISFPKGLQELQSLGTIFAMNSAQNFSAVWGRPVCSYLRLWKTAKDCPDFHSGVHSTVVFFRHS